MKKRFFLLLSSLVLLYVAIPYVKRLFVAEGDILDTFNGVAVYYNGASDNVIERNIHEGYNIGLKYQCVEFVKRYYYEYYKHKMPNTYGHAKDFFQKQLADGALNKDRNLYQFQNPSGTAPKVGDIIVFDGKKYGHVAIVTAVADERICIIQQNTGFTTRETIQLEKTSQQKYRLLENRILGWLRK